jgi:hypothetical protein
MNLTNGELIDKLKELGVVGLSDNKLISYTGFKKRTDIHKYGKKLKIVFLGHPRKNNFGFYVLYDTNEAVNKDAYEMLKRLVDGDMADFYDGNIQWGNCGIPISYGDLRSL